MLQWVILNIMQPPLTSFLLLFFSKLLKIEYTNHNSLIHVFNLFWTRQRKATAFIATTKKFKNRCYHFYVCILNLKNSL